ncbi:4-alpha-glucanotransferase [Dermatophilus congolensis]|uniref:4-alpha-glucanotransferase n=1 Tax=Dermatophilus congolensis TaxID=1863 RepID=UPI001AAE7E37|nr:4-alpha-glucanotransferase [Dermatophilus congolensis]MBO3142564.1 4-alpha-glucanotransferase [Dermatophilus congolensis]MBO3151552.1 4-alpha-glucanotransferase [Dermatophilus congolensis]MBO3161445.1 4-alpha-glucanotransferase [Dermatophilus congolensis]MBO3162837.1 4-alpha-glucanotransferase [Dermatophilus congolensis]MBO3176391.1 4-alpha-glucanotransferase [Dermatophilus congolensis]
MEHPSQVLADLARAYGVATEYDNWKGEHVIVSAETIRAVLGAFDVDASDDAAASRALREREDEPWLRTLPAFSLVRAGEGGRVAVHVPHGEPVRVWVELEDRAGVRDLRQLDVWVDPRMVNGALVGEATFELPGDLPLGWHSLHAEVSGSVEGVGQGTLVVVPAVLDVPEPVASSGARGVATQIYQVRTRRSWGMGDFADLGDTCVWAGRDLGADFVLVNPVHAAAPVPPIEPSPYLPTSRRFVDTSYIRPEDVPELAYADEGVQALVARCARQGRALNERDSIERNVLVPLKREALRALYEVPRSVRRQLEFEQFCQEQGQPLIDFATWCALIADGSVSDAQWRELFFSPQAPAVEQFRDEHVEDVGFEMWLQWVADAQLAQVQRSAVDAGMSVGVLKDMAVGVHPAGADAWSLGSVLARGVTVGAPPDAYSQLGQDWSQPPWRPDRLVETGYRPFRDMIRAALRHSGGMRIDHIIGFFRLWWVPAGKKPLDGTYVRLDHEAMIGILVLEAQRAGAVIVGEDLGTVEPWVRDYLSGRGILGTSIFWFEQDADGFRQPETYRRLCLSSVTTHDLPPTAGYLEGEHVKVRDRLGMFTQQVEKEWEAFHDERHRVLCRLSERGLVDAPSGDGVVARTIAAEDDLVAHRAGAVVEALHRYVSWTPSLLVSVAMADLAGDRRGVNQPGTNDEYPNWRVPLAGPDGVPMFLEELVQSRRAKALAACIERGVPRCEA